MAKKRGRPPKHPSTSAQPAQPPPGAPKRKRGRPRKSDSVRVKEESGNGDPDDDDGVFDYLGPSPPRVKRESAESRRFSPFLQIFSSDTELAGPSAHDGRRLSGFDLAGADEEEDEIDELESEPEDDLDHASLEWIGKPTPCWKTATPRREARELSAVEVVIEQTDLQSWHTPVRYRNEKGRPSAVSIRTPIAKKQPRPAASSQKKRGITRDSVGRYAITTPPPPPTMHPQQDHLHAATSTRQNGDSTADIGTKEEERRPAAESERKATPPQPEGWYDVDKADEAVMATNPQAADEVSEISGEGEQGNDLAEVEEVTMLVAEEESDSEEAAMLEELRALLEADGADSDSGDENETYEQKRQRKLRHNEALLAQLGLGDVGGNRLFEPDNDRGDSVRPADDPADKEQQRLDEHAPHERDAGASNAEHQLGLTKKRKRYERKIRWADDSTTKDDPLPGTKFAMAYLEIPQMRERARNEYCYIEDIPEPIYEETWSEPEDEDVEEEEEAEVEADDGIGHDEDSKRAGSKKGKRGRPRKSAVDKVDKPAKPKAKKIIDWSAPGTTCHQCRRKTQDDKMRCSYTKGEFACTLQFCRRCIEIRYGLDFDASATDFKCPRCMGYCNCSICLRKSGHGRQLVETGPNSKRMSSLSNLIRNANGEKRYGSVREYIQALLGGRKKLQEDGPTRNVKRRRSSESLSSMSDEGEDSLNDDDDQDDRGSDHSHDFSHAYDRVREHDAEDDGDTSIASMAESPLIDQYGPRRPLVRYHIVRLQDDEGRPTLKFRFVPQRTRAFSIAELASNPTDDLVAEPGSAAESFGIAPEPSTYELVAATTELETQLEPDLEPATDLTAYFSFDDDDPMVEMQGGEAHQQSAGAYF